jgi:tRNA uridine 5-carboxymethylaminomethyl modification enzyme
MQRYDVIVVGGGHSGIEAAHSAAKLGVSVLFLTIDIQGIGKLSCNPAVGGVAKGHLVREVDALGGLIAKVADRCAISYRVLNRSKGKAVWATRAQVDRFSYSQVARKILEQIPNVRFLQAKAEKIIVKNKQVKGIETDFGEVFAAKAVIICAGTFLNSTIHIGLNSFAGGRLYETCSDTLFESIRKLGIKTKHFKTGTCARLDKRSLDFSKMIEQPPDLDAVPFSFTTVSMPAEQVSCYITYTNKKTKKIILKNLKYSPLYTGKIKSTGVRYCPSLEDKIVRFSDRERHQVFIEPEGKESIEIYPNGISTSLPFDVQVDFIHSIEGLEKAVVLRPGYGIEHGVIDARSLNQTLESKLVAGLYFAGQVNGTTGYEEAAAQGIIAGINAALKVKNKKPFVLGREEAFIGVLIDDLTSKGTDEPYRMFTSRSEFRLSLRESNADIRLIPLAYKLGMVEKKDYEYCLDKKKAIEAKIKKLKATTIVSHGKKSSLYDFLKRPQVTFDDIKTDLPAGDSDVGVDREVEIRVKYEGFLQRENIWLRELKNLSRIKIPLVDYSKIPSLSKEVVEKLEKFKPSNLDEALRISGITPAAVVSIYSFIKRNRSAGRKGRK